MNSSRGVVGQVTSISGASLATIPPKAPRMEAIDLRMKNQMDRAPPGIIAPMSEGKFLSDLL